MSAVSVDNYFIRSGGNFRSIPANWCRKILNSAYGQKENVRLGNRTFKFSFLSHNKKHNCVSIYYVDAKNQRLVRVSDHWCGVIKWHHTEKLPKRKRLILSRYYPGKLQPERVEKGRGADKAKRLNKIGKCRWYLPGKVFPVSYAGKTFLGGVVDFSDLAYLSK